MNEKVIEVIKNIISDLDENAELSLTGSTGSIKIPVEDYYHAIGMLDTLFTLFGGGEENEE